MIIFAYLRGILGMFGSVFYDFFREGIWVVGFFYLLNKTFESEKLKKLSKGVIMVVLAFLLLRAAFQYLPF
ncbi:hypothetical protein BGM26_18275 [Bacillus sp. FJAT-29790]|uniref:hypothetical protein n=1 Tax=Bacillus sp. FJAT-29790 TaxID=1895002 RepID=UPI001C241231|nr:hypothetical protein [Bacillus sp. FJAT-29790]MBU8880900.1 hypothetical protein [Bacillus sp. FJAT-29790]